MGRQDITRVTKPSGVVPAALSEPPLGIRTLKAWIAEAPESINYRNRAWQSGLTSLKNVGCPLGVHGLVSGCR